jgi:hypothetical protein
LLLNGTRAVHDVPPSLKMEFEGLGEALDQVLTLTEDLGEVAGPNPGTGWQPEGVTVTRTTRTSEPRPSPLDFTE